MKTLSLLAAVLALGMTLTTFDAEAAGKRLGAGKSSGMQREASSADRSASPAAAPTMASSAAKPAAAAAPAAQPKRSWMGPLAGLAAGLGLAALASHFGFGEELASMMMIGLLVMAVLLVIGFVMRRRAAARQPALAGPNGLQYATAGPAGAPTQDPLEELSMPAAASAAPVAATGTIPPEFDVASFVRNAKLSFIRLQAANDAGKIDDIREFTTPEMFAELRMNIAERGPGSQHTDVVSLEAEVIEVVEEETRYVVSARFTGLIREEGEAEAESLDEIWHLVKPRHGQGGWVLAGIQQTRQAA